LVGARLWAPIRSSSRHTRATQLAQTSVRSGASMRCALARIRRQTATVDRGVDVMHVVDLVGQALRQRHRITPCPACGGPLVHSRARVGARCLRCGHGEGETGSRCWTCGAPMIVTNVPADLARDAMNGRADVKRLAPSHACRACGGEGQAQVQASSRARGWRKCAGCKRPLAGPAPVRGLDLCDACRGKHDRQHRREQNRRCRERVSRRARTPCVSGPVLTT
jgi:hypothetical protein